MYGEAANMKAILLALRQTIALVAAPLVICGCAPSVPLFVASPPPATAATSADACEESWVCTIRGTVSVFGPDGAEMGLVRLEDGDCVTLSLSRNDIRYLRNVGPIVATITGSVFRARVGEAFILKIDGRPVIEPICHDLYLFVPSNS